ncbi:MAG: hypothetical protein SOV63_05315 [Pyramidobacter porci]|uniref:hypothetical protein n=1 Tax=Pyramidobacter porci TaxID=2605789 RepID=UPI002A7662C3|nr:hypothetical protein [Pyramidobacter porci]MDY2648206.1 hypothetical protein [Pyramidobacter porci]
MRKIRSNRLGRRDDWVGGAESGAHPVAAYVEQVVLIDLAAKKLRGNPRLGARVVIRTVDVEVVS